MVNPRFKHKLYTFGYQGRQVAELEQFVTDLGAMVMDTRLNAYSPRSDFKAHSLKARFGDQYANMGKYLGNVNYKKPGAPIQLADDEGGIQMVAAAVENDIAPLILMCGCADAETCHRTWIAVHVAELTGVEVQAL